MRITTRAALTLGALAMLSGCGIFKGGGNKTPVLGERVPILSTENDAIVDPQLAAVQVVMPAPAANPAWSQPGGNAAKSMGHLALSDSPSQLWSASIKGSTKFVRLASSPVVAGGRLYVADTEGAVNAYAADSGALIWRSQTAGSNSNSAARFGGGVSVEGAKVYATNGVGDVVAMNTSDGAELWRSKPGGPLRGAPTLANGQVYVISQDNQLFALSQTDGSVLWTEAGSVESQGVFGVAAPASAQGTVVAGFSSGELNAYRYENGRSLWADSLSRTSISTSVSALADIDAEPVIDQGRVYAVGQGGRMVALEITSGQRLWEQNIGGISTPWAAGEWVFVVTNNGQLLCIARASGRVRWISQLPNFRNMEKKRNPVSWVGPVLAGNRLILLSSEGEMASVSVSDGSILSTTEVAKGSFTLGPVVADNILYTLADNGRLTAWR